MDYGLLIMAAGMGSRFGGLKQAAPIGPNGEMIIDYSVSDAIKGGFNKVIIVIRKDIEADFRLSCGKRIEKMIDVEYVYQELDALPDNFSLPKNRTKPWGTGHAILCAKDVIDFPFAVINADDYYGSTVFKSVCNHLKTNQDMCMAGYKLGNTLSKNGTVSRGVCHIENGFLKNVTEMTSIPYDTILPFNTIVSMNLWGFKSEVLSIFEEEFIKFLEKDIATPKSEFFIPSVVDILINQKGYNFKVLETDEKWYGITYKEDLSEVREALSTHSLKKC